MVASTWVAEWLPGAEHPNVPFPSPLHWTRFLQRQWTSWVEPLHMSLFVMHLFAPINSLISWNVFFFCFHDTTLSLTSSPSISLTVLLSYASNSPTHKLGSFPWACSSFLLLHMCFWNGSFLSTASPTLSLCQIYLHPLFPKSPAFPRKQLHCTILLSQFPQAPDFRVTLTPSILLPPFSTQLLRSTNCTSEMPHIMSLPTSAVFPSLLLLS